MDTETQNIETQSLFPETRKKIKLHNHVLHTYDEHGLEYLEIDNQHASARIALQGAHLMEWKLKFQTQPIFWMSSNARFTKARSIRGGIPICWPWFGAHSTDSTLCQHGFARVIPWRVIDVDSTSTGATRVILEMQKTEEAARQMSYPCGLTLTLTIGRRLRIDLATTNKAAHPFVIGEAFHTYLNVSDIDNVKITGMQDAVYSDKVRNYERFVEHGELKFNGEFDRVFVNHSRDCQVYDSGFNRIIHVSKSGSDTTVVWSPGAEKAAQMSDMGAPDEWRKMVCVETTNALDNMVVINPGRTHVLSAEYSIETM